MQRVFELFDLDHSGKIDLREFIVGLSAISDSTLDEKVLVAFKVFDSDSNGFIDRKELEHAIQGSRKAQGIIPDLERVVDSLYDKLSVPRDTQLNAKKFAELVALFPDLISPVDSLGKLVGFKTWN